MNDDMKDIRKVWIEAHNAALVSPFDIKGTCVERADVVTEAYVTRFHPTLDNGRWKRPFPSSRPEPDSSAEQFGPAWKRIISALTKADPSWNDGPDAYAPMEAFVAAAEQAIWEMGRQTNRWQEMEAMLGAVFPSMDPAGDTYVECLKKRLVELKQKEEQQDCLLRTIENMQRP